MSLLSRVCNGNSTVKLTRKELIFPLINNQIRKASIANINYSKESNNRLFSLENVESRKYGNLEKIPSEILENDFLVNSILKQNYILNKSLLNNQILTEDANDDIIHDKKDIKPLKKDEKTKNKINKKNEIKKNEDEDNDNFHHQVVTFTSINPSFGPGGIYNGSSNGNNGGNGNNGNGGGPDSDDNPSFVGLKTKRIMALPLSSRPLFPGIYRTVTVNDYRMIAALKAMMRSKDVRDHYLGIFNFKDTNESADVINEISQIYTTGTVAQVLSITLEPSNRGYNVQLFVHARIKIDNLVTPPEDKHGQFQKKFKEEAISSPIETDPSFIETNKIEASEHDLKSKEQSPSTPATSSLSNSNTSTTDVSSPPSSAEVLSSDTAIESSDSTQDKNVDAFPVIDLDKYMISQADVDLVQDIDDQPDSVNDTYIKDILEVTSKFFARGFGSTNFKNAMDNWNREEVWRLPDIICNFVESSRDKLMSVITTPSVKERLKKAMVIINDKFTEMDTLEKANDDYVRRSNKRMTDYTLREQIKAMQDKLGGPRSRDKLLENYRKRGETLDMSKEARESFDEEMSKIEGLEPSSAEYTVSRNYLDWLLSIPWNIHSMDNFDLKHASKVLNQDHFGIEKVKDRILEFIAVGKLCGAIRGKILCFVGPPGVGKTSVCRSIARALDRKYYRVAIGSVSDVAEIKGHRRTYIGSMPGMIINALKRTGTMNPLVVLDEVDKVTHGSDWRGNPSAALLEVLDPEQNHSFTDHYLDVPVDLSQTLFVCTANTIDTIPAPLLDRMEVINIPGYIALEKSEIAKNYLIPRAKKEAGLEGADVELTDEALNVVINDYCFESGVRGLRKQVEKVFRKASVKIIEKYGDKLVEITPSDKKELNAEESSTSNAETDKVSNSDKSKVSKKSDSKEKLENTKKESKLSKIVEELKGEKDDLELENGSEKSKVIKEHLPIRALKVPDDVHIRITKENLFEYLGPAPSKELEFPKPPAGVVLGLAVTTAGGRPLYIETVLQQALTVDSHAQLDYTGNLSTVMKESSQIAYSFARMFVTMNYPGNRFFERAHIHLHFPTGAIPKDGPSAGIGIATALLSLAFGKPISGKTAFTGEITATGRVGAIGGLREKTVAAREAGADTVVFPRANIGDWMDLPDYVTAGLTPVPVETYDEVFRHVFKGINEEEVNSKWKREFDNIEIAQQKRHGNGGRNFGAGANIEEERVHSYV